MALREDILGPREFRTAEKPSRDPQTGLLAGGTAYERTGVLSGKDRGRTYNVGQMKQAQRGVIAPSSNVKAVHDPTPQQKDKYALQSRLIHVSLYFRPIHNEFELISDVDFYRSRYAVSAVCDRLRGDPKL